MNSKIIKFLIGVLIGFGLIWFVQGAFAKTTVQDNSKKVTICHATSSESNPWVRIVVSENAIGGHFENPGSPLAGHEDDVLLEGEQDCPVDEVTPTSEPTITETEPTVTEGVTPTDEPTSTPVEPTVFHPSATPSVFHPSATPTVYFAPYVEQEAKKGSKGYMGN